MESQIMTGGLITNRTGVERAALHTPLSLNDNVTDPVAEVEQV